MDITIDAGPSSVSIRQIARELSRTPRSFENLLIRTPEGVASKKLQGLLTIPFTIFSWIFLFELRRVK